MGWSTGTDYRDEQKAERSSSDNELAIIVI